MPVSSFEEANFITGGLSFTTKMPCPSYSLPISACNVGKRLRKVKGTVCSMCYAARGSYSFDIVQTAMLRRLRSLKHPQWVEAMTFLIEPYRYFRWHDSGDVQDEDHFKKIFAVALALPKTKFWLPTREGWIKSFAGPTMNNLIIRFGVNKINDPPPKAWFLTSTVYDKDGKPYGYNCPAAAQKKEKGKAKRGCEDCRVCWSRRANVSYRQH